MRLHTSEAKFQESIALALTNGDLVAAAELEHIRLVISKTDITFILTFYHQSCLYRARGISGDPCGSSALWLPSYSS